MKSILKKRILAATMAVLMSASAFATSVNAAEFTTGFENENASLAIVQEGRYTSGMANPDGGVMEIIDYNSVAGTAYAVNGQTGNLTMISMENLQKNNSVSELNGADIDVKTLTEDEKFVYGDMTSIAVSPDCKYLAVAVQAEDYTATGRAVIFYFNADGTLLFNRTVETGVQPDMITFTPDGKKILTANEGEPREGYAEGVTDPMGTVTVISIETFEAVTVDFSEYDSAGARQALTDNGIVIKKNTAPSVDFEPEYIATTDSNAYISLQEANAIAVLNLDTNIFTGVYSVGYEDYSTIAVDIDKKDEKYESKTYESLKGIRMPDGISLVTIGDTDYLLTANEGDSREWGEEDTDNFYLNEDERNFGKEDTSPTGAITAENSGLEGKVVFFGASDYDGLDENTDYLFGGRSFTMFRVSENGIEEVFTSGNDFEAKTAQYFPEYFNCSNDDKTIDDRSGKKGPEAESVTYGTVGEKTYAFVTLERISGVAVYDITNPENVQYVNYVNSRDFSEDISGDVSPEGICFVSADESKNGTPYLLAACEVSGTVAVYSLVSDEPVEKTPQLNKTEKSLKAGKTFVLKVSDTDEKAEFVSSNTNVAKVSKNGKVTALKKGNATITVNVGTTTLKCKITVTTNPQLLLKNGKNAKVVEIKKNKTAILKVKGKAEAIENKITVSNKKVKATLKTSNKIKIKCLKKGTSKVKVIVNGVKKFTVKVTVK